MLLVQLDVVKVLPNSRHPNECLPSIFAGVPSAVDHPLALDEDDSNLTGVSSSNSKSSSGTPGLVLRAFLFLLFCYNRMWVGLKPRQTKHYETCEVPGRKRRSKCLRRRQEIDLPLKQSVKHKKIKQKRIT